MLERANIDPEVYEIHNQKQFDSNCQGQTICIVSFLPNIYDSSASQRNGYLEKLLSVAKKNRKNPFVFFWLQAGDQLDLEKELNLGFGFPAVVAIAPSKNKVSIMKGSYDQLDSFLSDLIIGKAVLDDLKQKPAFKKADKWDGKDAPPLEVIFR